MSRFQFTIVVGAFLAVVGSVLACLSLRGGLPAATGRNAPPNRTRVDRVANAEERARMERYVAQLQTGKKVVKSLEGPSGETIDCVDVYTQPSLRRPGMEKHEVEFAPPTAPRLDQREESSAERELQTPNLLYLLTGGSCPDKTVPMPRLTMETLSRFRTLDEFFQKQRKLEKPFGGGGGTPPQHEYAHASRTVDNSGAWTVLNLWSPYVEKSDEFSLSQLWVVRGSGSDRQTVEAGWQVFDDLYGDSRAHLFTYFTPDNYGSGGCYNLSCSGFVQVSNTVYPGASFTNYSAAGSGQYAIKLFMFKAGGATGNWWFQYGDTWVGYYPRNLFKDTGLRDHGAIVDFGGEIVNTRTDGRHTDTDMGSGYWPYEDFGYAAYQHTVRYVDTSNTLQRATGLSASRTNASCYDIDLHETTGSWEVYFYFGGPGRNASCP